MLFKGNRMFIPQQIIGISAAELNHSQAARESLTYLVGSLQFSVGKAVLLLHSCRPVTPDQYLREIVRIPGKHLLSPLAAVDNQSAA